MAPDDPRTDEARKRVLIVVENLPVPFDRRVWQEANALKEAGYGVAVICPKGKGYDAGYEDLDGIHVYRHALPPEGNGPLGYLLEYSAALFWEMVLALRVYRRHGFDVIHACNPPDLIFLVALFFKVFCGTKFLFDHHDINPELFVAKFGKRGVFHRILMLLERLTFWAADASVATNATFKRIAIERGRMPPDRVWIVKSYPDLNRFRRVPPDLGLKRGRRSLVGYVGIMAKQDGVDLLLQAMADVVKTHGREDVGCLIVGDGPELENLVALATDLELDDYVTFSGYLTGDALLAHLCAVDIGVIPDPPNEYNDKISMNKVFEYMALGIPFVQFDLTESRETAGAAAICARGDTPVALGAAILELVDDPSRRESMSKYGMARAAKEFSWQMEKSTLWQAYDTLLNSPHA